MNAHHPIRIAFALCLGTLLSGCGSAILHESWTSEQASLNQEPSLNFIDPCTEMENNWSPEWIEFERQVLELTNQHRAQGADCNTKGVFPPAGPVSWNSKLACAARAHSQDMGERGFFDHISPEGTTPGERAQTSGYIYQTVGENIAAGQSTPAAVVEGWLGSDGHCANMMNDRFTELGVGHTFAPEDVYRFYWTQVFGRPRI